MLPCLAQPEAGITHRRPARPVDRLGLDVIDIGVLVGRCADQGYLEEAGLIAGDAVHVLGAQLRIPIGGVGPAGADGG